MSYYHQITLNDGTTLSVQAHYGAYCEPRKDDAEVYTEVEIGFPSREIQLIDEYKEMRGASYKNQVYPYVPVSVVREVIKSAGGLKTLSPIPPGILTREDYIDIYERCSEKIPSSYKEDWLKRKAEIQSFGLELDAHKWCFEIYTFMSDCLIKDALDKWARIRIDQLDEWGVEDQPNNVDAYAHYKKSIKGWNDNYPLQERLDLIQNQIKADIRLKCSHDDWEMGR